jgi:Trk K+ transport system NAD-binding subunit
MDANGHGSALSQGANTVLGSPLRLLTGTLLFVATVFCISTMGYVRAGWPLGDAAYMVLLTIFSVGYGEVRPIDTTFLRIWTTLTIVLGCTGMIVLTGALVQVFTLFQFRRLLGLDRMQTEIENSKITSSSAAMAGSAQLAMALAEARHPFVIIERSPTKCEARAHGHLSLVGEATHEDTLRQAGIAKARVLASVLPDDAANVFITLSARNLNAGIEIIARGEAPSTESKLFHAGADKVVLPTHIGAERITELILYPATGKAVGSDGAVSDMKRGLHDLGLELEVVTAIKHGALTGLNVREAERQGNGAFFIVQIDRANGQSIAHPGDEVRIEPGDP